MARLKNLLYSFVVPVYNERASLEIFHKSLTQAAKAACGTNYEIIYCDDGSTDGSTAIIERLTKKNPRIKLLKLSRNFGKEVATTAGIHHAHGNAIITLDADGQHPVNLIPKFIEKWRSGDKVVIGLRVSNQKEGMLKRYGSKLFYKLFNRFTGLTMITGSTDYRLIDKSVQQEFVRMTERNRITRGLIDWLGYKREYIKFKANPRLAGYASYSAKKLFRLAVDSVISLSISPLYITAYMGAIVLPISALLGISMAINALLGDPLHLHATGSAYAIMLILFLIGILMVSQGIIGLYLSHIHIETQNRPLYVIDRASSINVDED
jgi:glycosyltransferase involved in cell wall biosynthesis